MRYLTVEEVITLHDLIVYETGGSHGVRDVGLLYSAVSRPQASFAGQDLYKSLFNKAAALFHSIIFNHAFIDGNKRTAISSAGLFLEMNGYKLKLDKKESYEFIVKAESKKYTIEKISKWFKKNSKRI